MAKAKAPVKNSGTGKRGGGINEAAAFAFYCESRKDGRLNSQKDVAKKFGVSQQTVAVFAKKNEWLKKRTEMSESVVVQLVETQGEMLARKNEEHMRHFEEIAAMGMDILRKEKEAYDAVVLAQDEAIAKGEMTKEETNRIYRMRKLAASRVMVAHQMAVDGIKGQRVALGLPTDVTKSMAMNFNATAELPRDEIEKMQENLDANYNKRIQPNGKQ